MATKMRSQDREIFAGLHYTESRIAVIPYFNNVLIAKRLRHGKRSSLILW